MSFLAVTAAVALLLIVRRLDGITNPQFWAEDGFVFFQDNFHLGCRTAVGKFFLGFPYLAQRLVACVATPVPLAWTPLAYNLVAYLIAAASVASFSLPAFRHVIRSDALRVFFCLAVAAMPPTRELIGSLTNTSWYLGVWLLLLTIARLPSSPLALIMLAAAVATATFSAPLAVLTAPLWLARGLVAMRRRRFRDAAFSAVALASVVAVAAVTDGLGRHPGRVPPLVWPVLNVVSTRVLTALVLDPVRVESLVASLGPNAVHAIALVTFAGLAALAWRRERRIAPVLLFCVYGILGSLVLQFAGRPGMAQNAASIPALFRTAVWMQFAGRYQVMSLALAYLALLAVLDRLPRTRRWSAATVLLLAWLIATQVPTFVLPPFFDLGWPQHAAQLERKLVDRNLEPIFIPINPDAFGAFRRVTVDFRQIMPEVTVPPETILGNLVGRTTFEQSFVARCADLSEIDLWIAAPQSGASQKLVVQLRDAATGSIKATFEREPATLVARTHDGAKPFYFASIPESKGRRYLISAMALEGTVDDAAHLYGSLTDTYADGEARRDGEPLSGDVAFRYGCTVP